MSRLTTALAVLAMTLGAAAPAAHAADEDGHASLRRISHHLIDLLPTAEVTPPLNGRPKVECVIAQPHQPFHSRFTYLSGDQAEHHLRVTAAGGGPGRVEMRDSLFFPPPQALSFEVVPDDEPYLEFGYHIFPCAGTIPAVTLTITTEDVDGVTTRTLELEREFPRDAPRFADVRLPLALEGGRPARVTLRFEADGPTAQIAWTEPVLTGRPRLDDARPGDALNVLLIVIDAVRADVVGPGRRPELPSVTPHMDALFARGTSFRRAFSVANQTRPSTVGLLSSQVPSVGGFHSRSWTLTEARKRMLYDSRPPLLPQLLRQAGWRVSHLGHNHFLWDSEPIGLDHGFDHAIDFRAIPEDTPATTEAALRYFERHADDRWFMMLNYTAPHTPYNPPEEQYERVVDLAGRRPFDGISRKYLGELAYVDDHLEQVFASLERLGLAERTLVILTADHGEVMHTAHACNSERLQMSCHFNHGLTLYDEEIHIPLVFALPERVDAGRVIETQTSHVDVVPTVLDLLGLPPTGGVMGRSIAGTLAGGPATPSTVYAEARYSAAIRVGDLKLIVHSRDDDIATRARVGKVKRKLLPKYEIFDTSVDPYEEKNLFLLRDERQDLLLAELDHIRAALEARAQEEAPRDLTPEDAQKAKAVAASGPPMSYGERAANVLRLEPDGTRRHLVARLAAPLGSTLSCGAVRGQASCEAPSEREILLTLAAEADPSSVAFDSEPWASPLEVELTMDGKTIPVDALRLGPYGLRLLRHGEKLDVVSRLELAAGLHPPHTVPGHLGIYLWRDPPNISRMVAAMPEAAAAQEEDLDANMDEEVRSVLRSLGYTK